MSDVNNDQNARQKLSELQHSIRTIETQAEAIDRERYALIKARNNLRKEITALITQTRATRNERDAITGAIKTEKEKRSELTTQLRQKIGEVKTFSREKGPNLGFLKHAINELDRKIETEVISFEKEKELMKRVNALKKQYAAALKTVAAYTHKREVSTEITTLRKSADTVHADIQTKAKLGQEKHELAVTSSKKIDELKKKLDELAQQITQKDTAFDALAAQINSQLKELNKLSGAVQKSNDDIKRYRKETTEKILSRKRAEVEAKLKRGEKLTTEDILVMQSGE